MRGKWKRSPIDSGTFIILERFVDRELEIGSGEWRTQNAEHSANREIIYLLYRKL